MPNSLPQGKYNGHKVWNVRSFALIAASRRDAVEREHLAEAVIGAGARDTT
jgi:hypothetical protein